MSIFVRGLCRVLFVFYVCMYVCYLYVMLKTYVCYDCMLRMYVMYVRVCVTFVYALCVYARYLCMYAMYVCTLRL